MNGPNAKRYLSPAERREFWQECAVAVLRSGASAGDATGWADVMVENYATRVGELAYGPAKEQPR